MKADTVLDYAIFELSQKHSRCELSVSSNGETEKLASGLIQPFVNHLSVLATHSLFRAEVETNNNGKTWFTRRTLARFVQYVNGPEVLERVNTFDTEMSQLEAARTLYSRDDGGVTDATKKELLRAIDLRLEAITKDLTTSIAHASANGFDPQTVSHLQRFAVTFGAHHLNEACGKYMSLCERRPELIKKNLTSVNETNMSQLQSSKNGEEEKKHESLDESCKVKASQQTRRLSVQDRINLFESKKTESSNSAGHKPVVIAKSIELRRLSSDVSSAAPVVPEKSGLRRWSVVSDMSFDGSGKEEGPSSTPSSGNPDAIVPREYEESSNNGDDDDDVCSTECDDFQNQTDDDALRRREEESFASKPHNVAHSRSRTAHIANGIDIKSDEHQSKSRKKEVLPSYKQPVLTTSTKPASADSAGKDSKNRARATSVDQPQRAAMSRESSQGVNYELKTKASDLEKIVTEHKGRGSPEDQPAGDEKDNKNVVMRRNVSDLSYSDDSKGMLYEMYMKKRDAKLREEWSSKETKLKSMQEAIERSRTEMKAKFSAASEKRQDSISSTRQRAEKLRSFNSRSSMKKVQHPISSLQSEEEDMKDRPSIGRSSQVRKAPSPNRNSRVSKPSELTTLYSDDMMNKEMNQKQGSGIDDVPENLKDDEFDEIESEAEEEEEKQVVVNPVKEEDEAREMETLVVEDIHVTDEKSSLGNDLPVQALPTTFQHNVGTLMDSPSESPISWNSKLQYTFSYPHEHSDGDESPMGSHASWSPRMRKKWGTTTTAQSPVTVSNSSPLHSRKDLAKGIKRLLKFGKKTRPANNLMDWVSVTTSEGDDDEQGSFKTKDGDF